MTDDAPPDHVLRPALPWRSGQTETECGRSVNDVASVIDRDALVARAKKLGKKRTYLLTCVTCVDTAERWPTWEEDPARALGREIDFYGRRVGHIRTELLALADLVAAHPDEFAAYLAGREDAARLAERRQEKERRETLRVVKGR